MNTIQQYTSALIVPKLAGLYPSLIVHSWLDITYISMPHESHLGHGQGRGFY